MRTHCDTYGDTHSNTCSDIHSAKHDDISNTHSDTECKINLHVLSLIIFCSHGLLYHIQRYRTITLISYIHTILYCNAHNKLLRIIAVKH